MARLKNRYLNDFDFVLWVMQGQGVDEKWSLEPKSDDFEEAVRIVKEAQRRRAVRDHLRRGHRLQMKA